jgi:hypothetical protein
VIKFGFKIKTRGGMVVDNLQVSARDRAEAEHKVNQIYHRCEIIDCLEVRAQVKEEGFDLESAINLIGKESEREPPAKKD